MDLKDAHIRVPFDVAISEPDLLKKHWDTLSRPQQVILKAFYGLPLAERDLPYWALLQGNGIYDPLGFPVRFRPTPYTPKLGGYRQLWAMLGRRSGKTSKIAALIATYETCLGGHLKFVGEGEEPVTLFISQNANVAKRNLALVKAVIQSSPYLRELLKDELVESLTFKNGIAILTSGPSIKAQRGFAIPCVVMDEVAFWYKDPESANPDFEVVRAVSAAQLQFPNAVRVGISTPYTKEGLLWKYSQAGTEGVLLPEGQDKTQYRGVLFVSAPTAALENPFITRERLEEERAADPDAFPREFLVQFSDAISGFLPMSVIQAAYAEAAAQRIAERAPLLITDLAKRPAQDGLTLASGFLGGPESIYQYQYVAAIDPAFRHDDFAFAVVHMDEKNRVVQDFIWRKSPARGQRLNPRDVLFELKQILDTYQIDTVYTDQGQFESLQELASDFNIYLHGVDFTPRSKLKIMTDLAMLFNQRRLLLLDPHTNHVQAELVQQLSQLEKIHRPSGGISIAAPNGKKDDLAMVLALACHKALWHGAQVIVKNEIPDEHMPKTPFQRVMESRARKARMGSGNFDLWD